VHKRFWRGTLRERDLLYGLGVGVRIILKCVLNWMARTWTGLI
jgi:hypothetical protein